MSDIEGNTHPEHIRNPEVAYEQRDLSARAIMVFLLLLVVASTFAGFIVWGMYRSLGFHQIQPQPSSTAIMTPENTLPKGDPALAFPAPKLQPNPAADLNKFRTRENQVLDSYGFVDKDRGVVRIPIERAMQLLVERGLPTAPPPNNAGAKAPAQPTGKR